MTSKRVIGIFLSFFIFSIIFVNLAGAVSGEPQVLAQSEAPRTITLEDVIERLVNQAADLKKGLQGLKNISKEQELLRQEYLGFLEETLNYYQSLEVNPDGSNIRFLAAELKEKRAGELGAEIKRISDFLLIFQTKSILKIAESRFLRIKNDLERLIDLKILKPEKAGFLLNEAHLLLVSANDLIEQAESAAQALGEPRSDGSGREFENPRSLLSEAIGEIKLAYKKFLEISNLLKEALK